MLFPETLQIERLSFERLAHERVDLQPTTRLLCE